MTVPGRVSESIPPSRYASLVALLDTTYEATTTVAAALDDDTASSGTRTDWTARELLFHQLCDAQRALIVLTTAPPGPPDTDAVTYWSAWAPGTDEAAAHARYVARAAAAYSRTAGLVAQWTDTSRAAVRSAAARSGTDLVVTQGHVIEAADFVHTLIVEAVVHHLDLTLELPSPGLPDAAYGCVLEVLTGLLGSPLPSTWSPREAALKGTGRLPVSTADAHELGELASHFPLFG